MTTAPDAAMIERATRWLRKMDIDPWVGDVEALSAFAATERALALEEAITDEAVEAGLRAWLGHVPHKINLYRGDYDKMRAILTAALTTPKATEGQEP